MAIDKDYYDILGIRPSAQIAEIELAFKGRRTQYHPDKYVGGDSDTMRWATAKMQEVNEAYSVLSDENKRRAYDSCRADAPRQEDTRGARASASPPPRSDQRTRNADDGPMPLHRFLSMTSLNDRESAERIWVQPDIPRSKLEAAIASYGHGLEPRDVSVLIDDTLFGGAKQGALLTNDALYVSDLGAPPRRILFNEIEEFSADESIIILNDRKFHKFTLAGSMKLRHLAKLVDQYLQRSRAAAHKRKAKPFTLDRAHIHRICAEFTKPVLYRLEEIEGAAAEQFLKNSPKSQPRYTVAPNFDPALLEMIRFSFVLDRDEEVFAFYNLTWHSGRGHHGFVVSETGLHSFGPSSGALVHVSWAELTTLNVIGEFDESVFWGVTLSDGRRLVTSWKNTTIRPLGPALVSRLIEAVARP
jgi:curved DNA-binding protein CbpA